LGGAERVRELSALGLSVGLQFEDKVDMTSIACAARDGVELWRVSHNEKDEPLTVTGEPPAEFKSIRARLTQAQADDDEVDFLHDIPIEVAESVCGYRAEDWDPPFAAVSRIGAPDEPERKGGLLRFVKGLFGSGR
jgi:hypothetical protein